MESSKSKANSGCGDSVMNVIENFARYEMRCAMTDGLFRPMRRGPRPKAEVKNTFGSITITFRMFDALGADDESVLLAVLSLMGVKGEKLDVEPEDEDKRQLRLELRAKGDADNANAGAIKTSIKEIAKRAGFSNSGKEFKHVRACLDRLSSTILILDDEQWHGSMTLLSHMTNKIDGRIEIACHWRLAEAIFGSAQFARVSLQERHQIDGDAGRILHRWLSAWVQVGKEAAIRMSKLEKHVWPAEVSDAPEAKKERLEKLRKALEQIGKLDGWFVGVEGRGWEACATVRRSGTKQIDHIQSAKN